MLCRGCYDCCWGPCNFLIGVCRSCLLCDARYRGHFVLRGVAMWKLVLVARWLGGVVFRYFSHTWLCCVSFRFGSDRFFSVRCGGTGRFNCVWFLLGRGDGSFWLGGSVLFGVSILILGVGMDDSSIVRGCECRQGC